MIQGGLFTRDFLLEGVVAEQAWRALSDAAWVPRAGGWWLLPHACCVNARSTRRRPRRS